MLADRALPAVLAIAAADIGSGPRDLALRLLTIVADVTCSDRAVLDLEGAPGLCFEKRGGAGAAPGAHALRVELKVGGVQVGTLYVAREAAAPPYGPAEADSTRLLGAALAMRLEVARQTDDARARAEEHARTQAELVTHERLAALGELAAIVAHEVRNPLAVIFNSLGSLRKILPEKAGQAGDGPLLLDIVGQEAERLNRIVADLLDFAKPYTPCPRAVTLRPLILSAVDAATRAVEGAQAVVHTDVREPDEPPLLDGHMISQALINLIINAIQAMAKGGVVTVRARADELSGVPRVRIDVADEGPGIAQDAVEQVFLPFYTTKATGTGLGLAIVKRIVDAHHGEVRVCARDSGGTVFTLWLPSLSEP